MGLKSGKLTEDEKQHYRQLLLNSKIPERYFNAPLSIQGDEGQKLRAYVRDQFADDAKNRVGAVVVNSKPGLAQSFARDITIAGMSTAFYYLQTFANRDFSDEGVPQSYTFEWFEQTADCPFSPRERYDIETRLMRLMDDGMILYLFTAVHPNSSKWWSTQFINALLENSSVIEVRGNGGRKDNKRVSVGGIQEQGQKGPTKRSRLAVR